MHVGKCVRLWESPSPRLADARHGALAGVHTLYSLYIVSTCTKHRYERLAEALQLYSPLQPSTALYSSTALHPLQYTTLYSTPLDRFTAYGRVPSHHTRFIISCGAETVG